MAKARREFVSGGSVVIFHYFVQFGMLFNIISMLQFSKYCGRLIRGRGLDRETEARYQARAQRWLGAALCFLGVAMVSMFLEALLT